MLFHDKSSLKGSLTLYGTEIRNRTATLRRPVGRTNISNKVKMCQRGRRYSKLVLGNSPDRSGALVSPV